MFDDTSVSELGAYGSDFWPQILRTPSLALNVKYMLHDHIFCMEGGNCDERTTSRSSWIACVRALCSL